MARRSPPPMSPEVREKHGAALRGRPKSKGHRLKLAAVNRINGVVWAHGRAWLYAPHHPSANKKGRIKRAYIVAEQMIGRLIEKDEVVHHNNLDPSDDRPENLRVMTRSAHTKLHWEQGDIRGRSRLTA